MNIFSKFSKTCLTWQLLYYIFVITLERRMENRMKCKKRYNILLSMMLLIIVGSVAVLKGALSYTQRFYDYGKVNNITPLPERVG